MKAWCQQQGIQFLEVRSVMTTTQVNGSNTDTVPVPDYVRDDSTHLSTKGARAMGQAYNALFSTLFTRASDFDETVAGNLASNPTFTGTGGTLPAGVTGVAPDNVTVVRTGTTATVTSAKIVKNGRTWLELSIDRSTMPDATTQESVGFTFATSAPAATGYHLGRVRLEVDAGDGWRGTANISGPNTWGMIPINNNESGITDPTAPMEAMTGIGYAGVLKAMPSSISTAPSFTTRAPSFRKGDGSVLKVRFAAPEVRPTTDTHLLMYNEAVTTAPTFTSSTTLTAPEEQAFVTQLTTSMPARLSLSGADAAQFSLKASGLLKMAAVPNYESPLDADGDNVYSFNIVLTPFNTTAAAVTVPVTLTITDLADGTVYKFTAADGTDVMALYPGVTASSTHAAGNLFVSGNTAKNKAGGTGGSLYFPVEATGGNTEVRVTHITGISTAPGIIVRIDTTSNDRVSASWQSGLVQISPTKGGVAQTSINLTPYTTPQSTTAGCRDVIYQIINDVLRVYQNGVELTATGGIDVAGCASGFNVSGISSSTSGSNVGTIDNLNIRHAAARVSRVVLKTLTVTADTLAANTQYAGTIVNYTGTPNMNVTVDTSGLFFVDGFNLRSAEPLGASGTVYSVTVAETNDNAVNSGRSTVLTITVP